MERSKDFFFPLELIATNVRNEILRLKRRKQLQLGDKTMDCEGGYESPTSPQSSSSPGRCSPVISLSSQSPSNKEKALFTFKQVGVYEQRLLLLLVSLLRVYNEYMLVYSIVFFCN